MVGGDDEGLALYLRKIEFLEPEEAAAEWKNGVVDGLVLPEELANDLLPHLSGAALSNIGPSKPVGSHHRRYLFVVRS